MSANLFGKENDVAFALLRNEEKAVGKDPLAALNTLIDRTIYLFRAYLGCSLTAPAKNTTNFKWRE